MHRQKEIRVRARALLVGPWVLTQKLPRRHQPNSAVQRSSDISHIRQIAVSTMSAFLAEPSWRAALAVSCTVTSCKLAIGQEMLAVRCVKSQCQWRRQREKWHRECPSRVAWDSHHCQLSNCRVHRVHQAHQRQLTFNRFKHCHHHQTSRESRRIPSSRHADSLTRASRKTKFSRYVGFV